MRRQDTAGQRGTSGKDARAYGDNGSSEKDNSHIINDSPEVTAPMMGAGRGIPEGQSLKDRKTTQTDLNGLNGGQGLLPDSFRNSTSKSYIIKDPKVE